LWLLLFWFESGNRSESNFRPKFLVSTGHNSVDFVSLADKRITGGWMNVCWKWCGRTLALILLPCFAVIPAPIQAQDKHVVSVQELSRDAARPAETRQVNETALRQLFTSEQGQQALKSANIDYSRVDKAVAQLSDEDLAKLAVRSRQIQDNFAAGRGGSLSDRDLLIIIIIAVLVIALVAVLR
jgi:hypothetical protein